MRMARRERRWRLYDRVWPIVAISLFVSSQGVQANENCRLFENAHAGDVRALKERYRYLAQLPPEEYGTNLTRAIVRGLKVLERDARSDQVPGYCDFEALGVGLGRQEPDPAVPARRDFRHVLRSP